MAGFWGGTLGTVVPAPGAAHPTVMDWRIQVFFFGHTGRTGAGSCWGAGSGPCVGSCSESLSTNGSVAPSTAAPDGTVGLEGNDELRVQCCKLRGEPRGSSLEMCDGGVVTCRGCCQVLDRADHLLAEVPIVRVCSGVVRGAVGGTHLVLNQEAPLPVGSGENTFRWGSVLSSAARLFHYQQCAAKIPVLK